MSKIQSIIFNKNMYTDKEAEEWIKDHGIKPIKKVHLSKNYYRFRIINPNYNEYKYYTKILKNGILAIIQVPYNSS